MADFLNPITHYCRPFPNRRCRKALKGLSPVGRRVDVRELLRLCSEYPRYSWLYRSSWERFCSNEELSTACFQALGPSSDQGPTTVCHFDGQTTG